MNRSLVRGRKAVPLWPRWPPARTATALALITPLLAAALGCVSHANPAISAGPPPGQDSSTYAFENVSVLPMDAERVLSGQTVVVTDGLITAVGPAASITVPAGAVRIDGGGRFLMPGLAEMHAHVPPVEGSGWPDRELVEEVLFLYLANGITTIRGMLGAPYQLELREALRRGEMAGPNFYVGAPSFRNPTPDEAERIIRESAAAGYDLQKIHPGASRESWDRMVRTAREVGITFAGHVPTAVGLEHALRTGMSTVDHLDGYVAAVASRAIRARLAAGENVPLGEVVASATAERIREIARLTVESGTWQVPTLYVWENLTGRPDADRLLAKPELRYISSQQRLQWYRSVANRQSPTPEVAAAHNQLRLDILRAIHEAGGRILMGTDAPQLFNVPGFSLHREVARMEAAGMSRYAILESGTRSVAQYVGEDLGLDDNFGTIAVGSRADLILLEANPLDGLGNLQRIAGVMVRGRWTPGTDIEARLTRIAAKYAIGA